IDKKQATLKVNLDFDSVRAAMARLDAMLAPTKTITVDLKDKDSIANARAELLKMKEDSFVDVTFNPDEKGFRDVLARIDQIRKQKIEETVRIEIDDAELDAKERLIRLRLAELSQATIDIKETVSLSYNEDRAGLEKVIAEIDAELRKVHAVTITLDLDEEELLKKRAELEAQLGKQPVKMEYDSNLAGLLKAKADIEALLGIGGKFHVDTELDEVSLRVTLAEINAKIKEAEKNKVNVKSNVDDVSFFKTLVLLKTLTKDETVTIFTKLNDASLFLAAAKLTGLRAATSWTKEFAETIGTLDRNLPIVAGAVLGISQLSAGVLSLVGNIFSLGNGLGEVARMGLLLAPALITGLGAVMIVMTGVFHDFGAAVNGDTKALAKLAPAGQQAAKEIKPIFAQIRETISRNFWDEAGQGMLDFVHIALPAVGSGLGKLAGSLGGMFSTLLGSFTKLSQESGVSVFFENLTRGFDVSQTGLSKFMDAFNTLAVVGSTAFPKIGRAFNEFADKFDAWVNRLAVDGTLNRWIDDGIQGLKDLVNGGVSLIKIWGNLGSAAQAAGGMTLHSFADALAKLDSLTGGARFQNNMRTIFEGAGQATDILLSSLGKLGPAMDRFSVTFKNVMIDSSKALSSLISDIGGILNSPKIGVGFAAFLAGVKKLFDDLRPAGDSVATILQTVGKLMGQIATDAGPLFVVLFRNLST
ncbi:MAG TPA: hypothetical protein VNA32_05425, partial [Actinomycetota bacterium]|nr:hypothetical protein [Actinomycetota bacterium]